MKNTTAIKIIESELADLGVSKQSEAYQQVYNNALAGSEIMSTKELKSFIENSLELLPSNLF